MPKPLFILLALALGCGAASPSTQTTPPRPVVVDDTDDEPAEEPVIVIEGRRFEGPYADWTAICGEPTEQEGRYERCFTRVASLDGGPFEKIATYHEGDPGSALFALKTSDGWFVPEVPMVARSSADAAITPPPGRRSTPRAQASSGAC